MNEEPVEDSGFAKRLAGYSPSKSKIDLSILDQLGTADRSQEEPLQVLTADATEATSVSRAGSASMLRVASSSWILGLAMGAALVLVLRQESSTTPADDIGRGPRQEAPDPSRDVVSAEALNSETSTLIDLQNHLNTRDQELRRIQESLAVNDPWDGRNIKLTSRGIKPTSADNALSTPPIPSTPWPDETGDDRDTPQSQTELRRELTNTNDFVF